MRESIKIFDNSVGAGANSQSPGSQPKGHSGHKLSARLQLLSARPAITLMATEHHRPLAGTKLFCLLTEERMCEQSAQSCYLTAV